MARKQTPVNTTPEVTPATGTRIALSGWGYWDVTVYPYGGDFRRLAEDTEVTLIEKWNRRHEYRVRFADGRIGMVDVRALAPVGRAA